jgi:hypothetical protein
MEFLVLENLPRKAWPVAVGPMPLHGDVSKLAMNVAMFGELLDVEFIQFIKS